jgi:hypothetical protein
MISTILIALGMAVYCLAAGYLMLSGKGGNVLIGSFLALFAVAMSMDFLGKGQVGIVVAGMTGYAIGALWSARTRKA